MSVSQSKCSGGVVAPPRRRCAAVAQFSKAGMARQLGAGVGPETPGGLSVKQPGSAQPRPLLAGVSGITVSQEDDVISGEETQPLWGQHDEETRQAAGSQENE